MHVTRRIATFAATVAAVGLTAGAALAAVSPAPETAVNGNGGYDARNVTGFTDNQGVVQPDQYSSTIKGGAQGAQLCNTTSGFGAQVGLASNNLTTVFAVGSVVGTLPAPGCPTGGQIPGAVTFPALSAVPYNHHVWVDEQLATKTKTVRVLICILSSKSGKQYAEPSAAPSTVAPTITASTTAKLGGYTPTPTPAPTRTVGVTQPTPTPTTATPTTAAPTTSVTGTPAPTPTQSTGKLHGYGVKCWIKTITIVKSVVLFQAQDLDAPVAVPVAGDLPGVQTRTVHVPAGTLFDSAGLGINQNLTGMTACAGVAADGNTYPRSLAGPAAYISAACQPVSVIEYGVATPAGGVPTGYQALTTQEGISPAGTATAPALVAPNNSISTVNVGPHAPTGSAVGSHIQLNTGNAPTA